MTKLEIFLLSGTKYMPNTDLIRLINSIGKSTFVRYYHEFADSSLSNQDLVAMLPSDQSLKARNTRTSKARKIFREGLEKEALPLICNAERIDVETATKARDLLNRNSLNKSAK